MLAQSVKNLPAMQEPWVRSLGWEDPLEKGMAAHSSILAWRIRWTEEPGGLQSVGSHRVRHDWETDTFTTCTLCWTSCESWWVPSTSHKPGNPHLSSKFSKIPPPRSHLFSEPSLRPWWSSSTTWHYLILLPNASGFARLVCFSRAPLCNKSTTIWPLRNDWKVFPASSKHGSSYRVVEKMLWWNS